MHATVFNTFVPDVLNSLQNKKSAPVLSTNFEFSFYFRSTEHSTLHSLKYGCMLYVGLWTVYCFQFRYLFDFTFFLH